MIATSNVRPKSGIDIVSCDVNHFSISHSGRKYVIYSQDLGQWECVEEFELFSIYSSC